MRKLLPAVTAGVLLAGPVAVPATVLAAPLAHAAPAAAPAAHPPVRAHAGTVLLGARALAGLPGPDALDVDLAVARADVDSAAPADRRASAAAATFRIAVGGDRLPAPMLVSQHAAPDHPHPDTAGLDLAHTPLAPLVRARLLHGAAQARWSDTAGPCAVTPLGTASTTAADLTLLGTHPAGLLPGLTHLPGHLAPDSLLALPGTVRSTATVALRDRPGQPGRAVVATSTLRVADLTVLAGSPSALEVRVVADPTLTATSTGQPAGATVTYRAPVLEVRRGGHRLGRLDAGHQAMTVPLLPTLPGQLGLGSVRLSLGRLAVHRHGAAVTGTAALLDLALLPAGSAHHGRALAEVLVGGQTASASAPAGGVSCPSGPGGPGNPGNPGNPGGPGSPGNPGNPGSPGGPGTPGSPGNPGGPTNPGSPGGPTGGGAGGGQPPARPAPVHHPTGKLAFTNAAYNPITLVAIGGALLLAGGVLVAAVPRRLRRATTR